LIWFGELVFLNCPPKKFAGVLQAGKAARQNVKIGVLILFFLLLFFLWWRGAINPGRYFSEILEYFYNKCNEVFDFSRHQNAVPMVIILTIIILLASRVIEKII